jgi:steroid 5-alpha reductase family enzyme
MSPLAQTLLTSWSVLLIAMLILWLVGAVRRDVSIIDPFWGTGFVIVSWVAWSLNTPGSLRSLLLSGLTTFWGLRLSIFLLWRNWRHGEDRRYAAMRAYHGGRFWWVSLFTVFLLQAAILWFVSLPIQVTAAQNSTDALGLLDAAGTTLWGFGFFFEAVGDWQLARFKSDPRNAGQVMDQGLWRYTRHPNYFGDCCVWWGHYLIAASGGAWFTVLSPLCMSYLLVRVSGVRLLERTIVDRRPDYAAYVARTNAFFPGPPRANRTNPSKDMDNLTDSES